MVAMKLLALAQTHHVQSGRHGPFLPGASIIPASSTWAWHQTRLEKSGTNGAKTCTITVGRVRISITSFDGSVTIVPYPFHSQMAKVQLSAEEIRQLRAYEAENKNRSTLLQRLDERIEAGSPS
jgi:hypothetical protein